MCILIGKRLAVFWTVSFTLNFLGLKMQKSTFLRKNGFESSYYKIDELVCPTWKTPNNWNFAYGGFFTRS